MGEGEGGELFYENFKLLHRGAAVKKMCHDGHARWIVPFVGMVKVENHAVAGLGCIIRNDDTSQECHVLDFANPFHAVQALRAIRIFERPEIEYYEDGTLEGCLQAANPTMNDHPPALGWQLGDQVLQELRQYGEQPTCFTGSELDQLLLAVQEAGVLAHVQELIRELREGRIDSSPEVERIAAVFGCVLKPRHSLSRAIPARWVTQEI